MTIEECYNLGRVTKMWGVKGQAVLFLDVDAPEDYAELDSAYVEVKGRLVPYFFHIDSMTGNKAVVTFEDATPEQVSMLVGCDLYLPLELLPKLDGNRFYFHEVVGFDVVDEEYGEVGTIASVIDYPAQPLFQIMKNGVEVLIPIVDEVIKEVDREHKTIRVAAPNGLIDLYLGDINKKC